MEGKLKIVLQVAFIAALIWLLAALSGAVPGASIRVGRKKEKCQGGRHRRNPNPWVASGMVGELIASPGTNVPRVGVPLINL